MKKIFVRAFTVVIAFVKSIYGSKNMFYSINHSLTFATALS